VIKQYLSNELETRCAMVSRKCRAGDFWIESGKMNLSISWSKTAKIIEGKPFNQTKFIS